MSRSESCDAGDAHRLYFAYGSLMSKDFMARMCPDADPHARASLHGYTRQYRGPLTVVQSPGDSVTGALFRVAGSCEEVLDRYEGYPDYYGKSDVRVRVGDPDRGITELEAFVYTMNGGEEKAPSRDYLALCIRGAEDWGIDPAEFIDTLPEDFSHAKEDED